MIPLELGANIQSTFRVSLQLYVHGQSAIYNRSRHRLTSQDTPSQITTGDIFLHNFRPHWREEIPAEWKKTLRVLLFGACGHVTTTSFEASNIAAYIDLPSIIQHSLGRKEQKALHATLLLVGRLALARFYSASCLPFSSVPNISLFWCFPCLLSMTAPYR